MIFTGERCGKCKKGAIALQETFDLCFEDEFVCVNCGKMFWRPKTARKEMSKEDLDFICELRGELVGPQNHSGVVLAVGGCKYKSKSSKKRSKKWKREPAEKVMEKCGV